MYHGSVAYLPQTQAATVTPTTSSAGFGPKSVNSPAVISSVIATQAASSGRVGHDSIRGAVGVLDLKLGQPLQAVAVDVASPPANSEAPAISAVSEHRSENMAPFGQQMCDVECQAARAMVVAGPAWHEDVVARLLPAEIDLVDAGGGHVQTGSLHARNGDPLRGPEWLERTRQQHRRIGLDQAGLAPNGAVRLASLDLVGDLSLSPSARLDGPRPLPAWSATR